MTVHGETPTLRKGSPCPQREKAIWAAKAAARAADLDPTGAELVRMRSASTVVLPRADVVARVEVARDPVDRQVAAARFWKARGAPVMRLAVDVPFGYGEQIVTLWHRLPDIGTRASPSCLGHALRVTHGVSGPPFEGLRDLDPFEELARWRDAPGEAPRRALGLLSELTDEAIAEWRRAGSDDPLGRCLVHGDPHPDNVVMTSAGPVLVDLELAGVGPASWDLAVLAVGVRRYGAREADFLRLVECYGADPTSWWGFGLLCRVYELLVTWWALHCVSESPEMGDEALIRLSSMAGGIDRTWSLF